jgi:hypothetical protein
MQGNRVLQVLHLQLQTWSTLVHLDLPHIWSPWTQVRWTHRRNMVCVMQKVTARHLMVLGEIPESG